MEETMTPVSELPVLQGPESASRQSPRLLQVPQGPLSPQGSDQAITESINQLEKQVIGGMDSIVEQLQSLQQAGSLDKATLNAKIHRVLSLAQVSLLIQTLPLLLAPPSDKANPQTAELYKKIYHLAETLKALWKKQTAQAVDSKALKILAQIKAKEQQIKQEIAKKQGAIAEIISAKKPS